MVISVLVGISKPEPAIYTLALERLGVNATEALFVDDLMDNVLAARQVGMAAVLIDRDRQVAGDGLTVRDLAEVADLVLGEQVQEAARL